MGLVHGQVSLDVVPLGFRGELVPVIREGRIQVLPQHTLHVVLHHAGCLGLQKLLLQLRRVQPDFLPALPDHHGLRPNLVNGRGELVQVHLLRHGNGPEPAVACPVLQVLVLVGCAEEHALPFERGDVASVCGAVGVLPLGQEGLYRLHVAPLRGGQLRQLDDPVAVEGGVPVLAVHADGAVVEPALGEDVGEAGLAEILCAVEHDGGVELAAGIHHPRHGPTEPLAGDGPDEVLVALSPQEVDEHSLQAGRSVPGEPVQVVLHRVEGVGPHGKLQGALQVPLGLEPPLQL